MQKLRQLQLQNITSIPWPCHTFDGITKILSHAAEGCIHFQTKNSAPPTLRVSVRTLDSFAARKSTALFQTLFIFLLKNWSKNYKVSITLPHSWHPACKKSNALPPTCVNKNLQNMTLQSTEMKLIDQFIFTGFPSFQYFYWERTCPEVGLGNHAHVKLACKAATLYFLSMPRCDFLEHLRTP